MTAGKSTREASDRARTAAETHERRAAAARQRADNFSAGASGEREVAEALATLTASGWYILHDRAKPNGGNIDHVAVGPPGVVVIDAKAWTSAVEIKGERLFAAGRFRDRQVDGLVSQVVSEVDWTAVRGGGIAPGHYEDFDVLVGAMPTTPGQVVLKALQTYSNGQIVRWIQLAVPGEPAPDTPAPILTLTRGVAVAASATGSTGTPTPNSAGGNGNGGGSGDAGTIALVAVIVAIGALVAAVVALLRGRNQSGPDPAAGPSEDDDSGTSGNDAPDAGAD